MLPALTKGGGNEMPVYNPTPPNLERYARWTFLVSVAILLGTIVLILLALFG
jgi:hypothetical protein